MDTSAYVARNPKATSYYQLVENHFESLERRWDERYVRQYGYWRSHITRVIWDYLDCGDLRKGFARIRCKDCGHEHLLPFSCKRRHFCPSCHERRVVEFGELLASEVLADAPHRHWVFSIPKMLRPWFLFDRRLLGDMCSIVWKLLSKFILASSNNAEASDVKAASVMSIQTFGEQVNFNPHIHVVAADGCFTDDGTFTEVWAYETQALEDAFADAILTLLQDKGLDESRVQMIRSWHHSGFNVYRGPQILAGERERLERLSRYIVRCPFAMTSMTYLKDTAQVAYRGKTTGVTKMYPAMEFLARLVAQIPAPREQMVRYYGFYSNKARGQRKKSLTTGGGDIALLPPKRFSSRYWAQLIAKVYLDDPLICPKCSGRMKIVSFVEQDDVITKILKHLGLWESLHKHPVAHAPPLDFDEYYEKEYSQLLPAEFEHEAC